MRALIAKKLETLPPSPGVYLMKDDAGEVFYVGKAKSLRDRVRSYFSGSDDRFFVAVDSDDPKFDETETLQLMESLGGTHVEAIDE